MNPSYYRVKEWRRKNPKKHAAQMDRHKKYLKEYYEKNKKTIFRNLNLKRYGLTVQTYNQLLKSQNRVCAICFKKCTTKKMLAVDHNHKTKKNRGLLCKNCNIGLGMFFDSKTLLNSAIIYLKRNDNAFSFD